MADETRSELYARHQELFDEEFAEMISDFWETTNE